MLGAVFGGMTAANTASGQLSDTDGKDITFNGEEEYDCVSSPAFDRSLGEILIQGLGIVRSGESIRKALEDLKKLECANSAEQARKSLAEAMLLSALTREESRGAHYREDFPAPSETMRKTAAAEYAGGKVMITLEDITELKNDDQI